MLAWWRSRKRKWLWIVGAFLLGLFVVAGIAGNPRPPNQAAATAPTTSPATSPTTSVAPVAVPPDLVGKNAVEAQKALTEAGFTTAVYESVDGRQVMVPENWTVVAIEQLTPGQAVIRVDKPAPATRTVVPPAPAPPPAPEPPTTEPELPEPPADAYYANCAAARAAGAAPIHRGEPGYRPALDRNNDGTACE
ncbi:excalibur calcium-binding domain-containing protein [Actinokineospora globicatena]|uniref:excalibur calcium-binding domain-containing protein n=1 Tax=Actinokineospora globicatena TaxID=103729 RepID=UPI0020A4DBF8|nr:excalibur calcium-binding domain-containing protein [Actinokineospora globicatena]MCP2306064.1 Excalibur calcium-binding domain-containing protein [Actinokineospora globicatena]GLW80063.1 hypothetical protein Aglo01_45440 [Actinokineospora globicatena]GLW86892.1 hypothetical protein Aglo02_45310 [Actinokineospora globicatena]